MVDDTTWVFATTGGTDEAVEISLIKNKFDIEPKYVQSMQDLKDVGTKLTYDYQSVFNLSYQQIHDVYDYMCLWSVLRRCCKMCAGIATHADYSPRRLELDGSIEYPGPHIQRHVLFVVQQTGGVQEVAVQ